MSKKIEKSLSAITILAIVICGILAFYFHDIPSCRQGYLEGVEWLLHWGMVLYIPIFPIMSILITLFIYPHTNTKSIFATNLVLTTCVTIFACAADVLKYSWIAIAIASGVSLLAKIYGNRNKQKSINESTDD